MTRPRLFTKPFTPIVFGTLEQLPDHCPKGVRYVVVTDKNVEGLYGKKVLGLLKKEGLEAVLLSFPSGEEHKTRETKQSLEDRLLQEKCGRDTCIIALGGGVVSDLTGFVAATYCRGVPWISVPTTLLGMVDAGIGGKTGVNTPHGKNMIGAYYPPARILMDATFLKTLPSKEWKNGIAEVFKYGLIASKPLWDLVEQGLQQELEKIICDCIAIKMRIVEKDPQEKGLRRTLNFGHTVGHALEKVFEYSIPHGDAVALGMLIESYLSMRMGSLKESAFMRICRAVQGQGFPMDLFKKTSVRDVMEAMALDKKSVQGMARFVILKGIGRTESFGADYCTPVKSEWIEEAYAHFSR